MATCANCKKIILMGGLRQEGLRFCGKPCLQRGQAALLAARMPEAERVRAAQTLFRGPCPTCNKRGGIDLYKSHYVMSFVLFTRHGSHSLISCRTCALKKQGGDFMLSSLVGWWGIPFGLLLTPVALLRNGYAMLFPPNGVEPSPAFQQEVALRLACAEIDRQQAAQNPPQQRPEKANWKE